jgi:hypothetical protein
MPELSVTAESTCEALTLGEDGAPAPAPGRAPDAQDVTAAPATSTESSDAERQPQAAPGEERTGARAPLLAAVAPEASAAAKPGEVQAEGQPIAAPAPAAGQRLEAQALPAAAVAGLLAPCTSASGDRPAARLQPAALERTSGALTSPLAAGEAVSAAPHGAQAACLDGQNLASAPDGQREHGRSQRPADEPLVSKPFLGGLRDRRTGALAACQVWPLMKYACPGPLLCTRGFKCMATSHCQS